MSPVRDDRLGPPSLRELEEVWTQANHQARKSGDVPLARDAVAIRVSEASVDDREHRSVERRELCGPDDQHGNEACIAGSISLRPNPVQATRSMRQLALGTCP